MRRIASFEVNHDVLEPGMYTSRVDGDIVTYDIRMVRPNGGIYIEPAAAHTFEHLFATFMRNTVLADKVIYCGPMGCQTGFYFLVRDMQETDAIHLTQESMAFIAAFEGDIPGATKIECGNYLLHDLEGAKRIGEDMKAVLHDWTPEMLIYKK